MSQTVVIESASVEPVDVALIAAEDPTATAPDFVVTLSTITTPTGTWIAGSWLTAWTTAGNLTARTPTIGATGQLVVAEGARYTLWARWGTVIKRAAQIIVN